DSLTIVQSENGRRQHNFSAPLYEHYALAREPYMEFRQGVTVRSFDDSTDVATSTLVADYAIFFEKQQLWEAKGNVVAINKEGQKLETQQLFWNQKTKKVYSNVDTRVTQPNGERITGVGFESDETMTDWVFRRPKGQVIIDTDPNEKPDTTTLFPEQQPQQGTVLAPTLAERPNPGYVPECRGAASPAAAPRQGRPSLFGRPNRQDRRVKPDAAGTTGTPSATDAAGKQPTDRPLPIRKQPLMHEQALNKQATKSTLTGPEATKQDAAKPAPAKSGPQAAPQK
ncbi:MAG: LPS export ABC transporter periplasmic protein LptC, partial [Rikenellaceae bacterium]|nr:LPS export ABC transporter periplasmic protein LptC [Rikenellaceae bacterium]